MVIVGSRDDNPEPAALKRLRDVRKREQDGDDDHQ
jgi:hypothetical protein